MKIHEYQAKMVLGRHGVPIPKGDVVVSAFEAHQVAERLGTDVVVVKAQIHAGGRGKGGGIRSARGPAEAERVAEELLGMQLVTHQTGPEGRKVARLLVEEGLDIERELYLGLVLDRAAGCPVMMASATGGMDIEQVAADTPALIVREHVHPTAGLAAYQARKLAFGIGLGATLVAPAVEIMRNLYQTFLATDASLLEINPLVITRGGQLLALDAKIDLDDNALFRHKDLAKLRDLSEEEPLEVEASKHSLNYIRLDGTIGCMVNGAGLAMATMDVIKLAGGEPANFLDVGGGANAEQIRNAFKILVADANVKAVFINIFGGILRCDVLAKGIIAAAREVDLQVPLVIRMEGTNVEQGWKMLQASGLSFTLAETMAQGAEHVVRLA
ncbi:MAG: ADP-forming succinate--CoA ligase subunit beta [Acidobacteria bacterium]|nr:ADP-forming succinate--CoA ligase subunit beta [Acidobacteriota bacterium]MCH2277890.1 ADP-forming succinate--CoA ligase subunit beta [Vicinamibacterales bacterium]